MRDGTLKLRKLPNQDPSQEGVLIMRVVSVERIWSSAKQLNSGAVLDQFARTDA
jgi:hypothetical protein